MAFTNKDNEIKGEKQRNESMKQRRLFPTSSSNCSDVYFLQVQQIGKRQTRKKKNELRTQHANTRSKFTMNFNEIT